MEFSIVKQPTCLPIENEDFQEDHPKKHGSLFPATVRCLLTGPSNSGKTNVVLNIIEHENGLKFENVYVYSRSLAQPKYVYLEKLLEPIKGIGYYTFNASENIIHPSEAKLNSIFIFDDVISENQDVVRQYFSMGRHSHIDSFYLCQTYAKIPKHLIRDNANFLILFKQDDMNLKHIYNDHIGTDMSFDEFKKLCSLCWKEPYGFLCISKDNAINDGRYRRGLDHYIYFKAQSGD